MICWERAENREREEIGIGREGKRTEIRVYVYGTYFHKFRAR